MRRTTRCLVAPFMALVFTALGLRPCCFGQTILERLHTLDLLYWEPESRAIRLAYPFSTVPTKHLVRFPDWAETKPVYAPCAVDALGIPFMLRRDLFIESSCGYCKTPLTIEVQDRTIAACTIPETVLWVGTVYCDHAATSICPTLDFFCSSAHVGTVENGAAAQPAGRSPIGLDSPTPAKFRQSLSDFIHSISCTWNQICERSVSRTRSRQCRRSIL